MLRLYAIMAAGVLVAAVGGIWLSTLFLKPDEPYAECGVARVAGGASQIGGPFELINSKGETVTDKDVITEPALIYFGYTFCPDVCPFDASRNADAVDLLADRGYSVTPVFISIDPERDTPEVVGDFAENMHEKMIGLTGSDEQVKAASQAYRTYFKAHKDQGEFYLVDHSTYTYLVLPGQGFVQFFSHDTTAEDMAEQTACVLDRS
ncbi:SCO family protein [Albibacillus kandeliae]|uniref:SCO family protein n=1 Tax=Albibacillus kandeliae TaxID=2174228 RepID=UPI000D69F6B3|nr:SCO family protein [Albibacillus kandeliae]